MARCGLGPQGELSTAEGPARGGLSYRRDWIEAEHTVGWGCLQGGTDTNSYIYIDETEKAYTVYIYMYANNRERENDRQPLCQTSHLTPKTHPPPQMLPLGGVVVPLVCHY